MYRIIATDLDETMLNDDHEVSTKDIETINKLADRGVKFVLATGRGYNSTFELQKRIGLFGRKNEYVISFNGGIVTDNYNNEAIYRRGMSFDQASALFAEGLRRGLCTHVYTEDKVYIVNYYDEEKRYTHGRMPITEVFWDSLEPIRGQQIIKTLFMDSNVSNLEKVEKEIKDLTEGLAISYSSNRYLEFNNRNANKGIGLQKLAELLNVPIEETIAVGDNINDLAMIKTAGMGIGVRNSNPLIIPDCDLILDATNNDDPITEIYNRFYR